jgi:hypothetical protein
MGGDLRVVATVAKTLRQRRKFFGNFDGERLARFSRSQNFRLTENGFENLPLLRIVQLIELDLIDFADTICEIGMDVKSFAVADDKERRILQGDGILLKLCVGGSEVFSRPLIFPAKRPALPNVGPPVCAGRFGRSTLEAIGLRIGARRIGRRLVKKLAKIDEVGMGCLALGKRIISPFGNEFVWCHLKS